MKRALVVAGVAVLVVSDSATAAIFIRLAATTAHRGGVIHVVGNAAAMPLYSLPVSRMPSCMRYDTCASLMRRSAQPKPPFLLIGQAPGTSTGFTTTHRFTLRLPSRIPTGRYKIFVWCEMCGGTLIPASTNSSGSQTLRIVP